MDRNEKDKSKNVDQLRKQYGKKYGIESNKKDDGVNDFKIEYKKLGNIDKGELAIVFECKPEQIATNLKEFSNDTKYLYLPKLSDRVFLAKETSNEFVQHQLLNSSKDFYEIATQLIFNPNLTAKIANEIASISNLKVIVQNKNYEDRRLTKYLELISSIETWSNPNASIHVLLTFINLNHNQKQTFFDFEKYIFNEKFTQSLANNKQITLELIKDINTQNKSNKYKTNLFLALYPETPSLIIEDIVQKLDLSDLGGIANSKQLIELITLHKNTQAKTLAFLWDKVQFFNKTCQAINSDKLSLVWKNHGLFNEEYFYQNDNTPMETLEANTDTRDDPISKAWLVKKSNINLEKRIEYLKQILNDYDLNASENIECNDMLFKDLACDQKTPIELISLIIDYLFLDSKNREVVINIISKNPNLLYSYENKIIDQNTNKVLADVDNQSAFCFAESEIVSILTYDSEDSQNESNPLQSSKIVKMLDLWQIYFWWENIETLIEKNKLNQEILDKLIETIEAYSKNSEELWIKLKCLVLQISSIEKTKIYPKHNFD